jgi:4-amino-4-deoxy-L-arabinose transferase-like glycosyltransferase
MPPSIKASHQAEQSSSFLSRNREVILLLVFAFILFFYKLGNYPLFDLDEPRYAEAAREMLENGNWITPYFNYELRFDKPIFFYWLIAGAYKLFGLSEFSARFFSAITATLTVLGTYLFGKYWISKQYGFFSALILSTSILFVGIARMSITDMTLSFFITSTILSLFMAAHQNLKWWLVAGFFAGFGVLTKGPVALVLPGTIFILYTLFIGEFKRCLLNKWLPLALILCLAIALPWYILAYQQNGPIFLDMLFLHNVTRFSDVVSGHKQPPYFYSLVLLAGFLPWSGYLPAAFKRLWEQTKAHKQHIQTQNAHYLIPVYTVIWIGLIFIFFSFGNTKLLTYILPLFPALALWVGESWFNQTQQQTHSKTSLAQWFTIPAWSLTAITFLGGILFISKMDRLLPREAAGIQGNIYNWIAVFAMLLGTAVTAWLLSRKKTEKALLSQALSMAVILIISMQGIIPNVSKASQGVMMDYLRRTAHHPLMIYEIQRPSLTFYGQRRIPRFVEEQQVELVQELNKNKQTFVITKRAYLNEFSHLLPSHLKVQILEKGSVYSLLSVDKAP